MSILSPRLQTVSGVKDVLPDEAWKKRQLEYALVQLFGQWGYQEVLTPTFEYYEVVAENDSLEDELFKFIDREGRILVLRPDLTTPIARLVSTHYAPKDLPLRLFYTGNVFRYESTQTGRQREFSQAGVELIGAEGVGADVEVIALAIESMLASSLTEFKIGIGQVMVIKSLIEEFTHDPGEIHTIKQAIITKNFVGLENILQNQEWSKKPREELLGLATLNGSREVLQKAGQLCTNTGSLQVINDLEKVYDTLENYGLAKYIFFDFSILRNFDYYTGIVFEGYATGLGYPVCGGGRYDGLLSRFGLNAPAVGFALGQERVMLAQKDVGGLPGIDYLVTGLDTSTCLNKAKELRDQGKSVAIDYSGNLAKAESYAKEAKIDKVIVVGGGTENAR